MRALIVYESLYGNTHIIANSIAEGLRDKACDVHIVPVTRATATMARDTDLLIVGGPTHMHGMTSGPSRRMGAEAAVKPGSGLDLEPDAAGPGLRAWLHGIGPASALPAAAFDTRLEGSALLTGRASQGIAHRLRQHGYDLVVPAKSFLVSKQNALLEGEAQRARTWGAALAFTGARSATRRPAEPAG
jgi:Flavodoxin domain